MSHFVFEQQEDDVQVTMIVDSGATWWELSEKFFSFLQASGYVLSREQFAEYWADQLEDQIAEDNTVTITTFGNDVFNTMNDSVEVTGSTITLNVPPIDPGEAAFSNIVNTLRG